MRVEQRLGRRTTAASRINPLAVEGQVQGAVWMGMGQALCEETQYHEGLPLRPNLLDYRIPTIVESPPIEVKLVESHRSARAPSAPRRPAKARCTASPPALAQRDLRRDRHPPAPSLPITPDRVLERDPAAPARRSGCAPAARAALRPQELT